MRYLKVVNHFIWRKITASVVISAFLLTSGIAPARYANAQEFYLPQPGLRIGLSPAFDPPSLKGVKIDPVNPLLMDFILDRGNSRVSSDQLVLDSTRLVKYFLAALTVPEKDLWVTH
ncbi:MAG: hypothetical protein HQL20_06125 [Candidatus Omnitrophica bacterium]|nr:hypothetical protein [Candidatus Omnitrophota bacterium]